MCALLISKWREFPVYLLNVVFALPNTRYFNAKQIATDHKVEEMTIEEAEDISLEGDGRDSCLHEMHEEVHTQCVIQARVMITSCNLPSWD